MEVVADVKKIKGGEMAYNLSAATIGPYGEYEFSPTAVPFYHFNTNH